MDRINRIDRIEKWSVWRGWWNDGDCEMRLLRGGIAAVMPRMPQKWYNMQQIDMSGDLPMVRHEKVPGMRYSAAYPTGRERFENSSKVL